MSFVHICSLTNGKYYWNILLLFYCCTFIIGKGHYKHTVLQAEEVNIRFLFVKYYEMKNSIVFFTRTIPRKSAEKLFKQNDCWKAILFNLIKIFQFPLTRKINCLSIFLLKIILLLLSNYFCLKPYINNFYKSPSISDLIQ